MDTKLFIIIVIIIIVIGIFGFLFWRKATMKSKPDDKTDDKTGTDKEKDTSDKNKEMESYPIEVLVNKINSTPIFVESKAPITTLPQPNHSVAPAITTGDDEVHSNTTDYIP
jgi:FtsZ-interacting cell division protein ZipA